MLKIQNAVSETLLIPLYMKYLDAQQSRPILNDPAALRLVPQIDYDFTRFRSARNSRVGTALRARYFDQVAADHTPFYQLDLPDVIALRETLLPPQANETLVPASAFDTGWMERLRQSHPAAPVLFILEGVLMYFAEVQVRELFQQLAQRFRGEIAFDVAGTFMVKHSDQHDALKHARARFDFACDDDRQMESWAANLHLVSAKHMTDFPEAKDIGLNYWLMRLFPKIRHAYRLLHYRID